jgi:hypothetical protein
LQTLGIVVDADYDAKARWEAIVHRLENSGYIDLPRNPDPAGSIIIQDTKPTIGVWIMPNNFIPGILEDFVAQLIPQDDLLKLKVQDALVDIEVNNLSRYSAVARPKAFIHTWLAWQENPGQPMGQAITAHVLQHDNEIAVKFVAWLTKLFSI